MRQGFDASNLERVVLLELSAPKVLNTDMLFRLFPDGGKVVTASNEQIVVAWGADEHPRSPRMVLTVNRFSLEAYEYFQIKRLGAGREVYEWTRDGSCKVDKRQF